MFPTYLAAIAVIGLGAILLFQGATVVLHHGELLYETGATDKVGAAEVSHGLTTEFLAGMTGIVLGVLARKISRALWLVKFPSSSAQNYAAMHSKLHPSMAGYFILKL